MRSNADLHHVLGATLAKLGDYANAERELAEAIRLNPLAHTSRASSSAFCS